MTEPTRPDAVLVPESLKTGARFAARIGSILDIAEPLLELDRAGGERAYLRRGEDGVCFVTRDPHDTIWGATGTDRAGKPRYAWEPGPREGVKIGRLIDGD